ncbi:MAG: helix-turn-helix domain-containing protein, partial [Mycetocola sp.]
MNVSLNIFEPDEPLTHEVDPRTTLLTQLAGSDPVRRREALRAARSRRWIDTYGEVVVRAVVVDGSSSSRQAFVDALSASGRGHTLVIESGEEILLVTSTHRTRLDIEEWTRSAAVRNGVHIVAPIGSANLHVDEVDIERASRDARATTELLMLVGVDTVGTTRAEDLGMWRLLHGMTGSPELVAAASPAADELWRAPDQMRRSTVEAYLDSGCSVAIACRTLFIHRTTLYYRLESMSDTVRDALADGLQRSTLHLGLKLLRLWDSAAHANEVSPSSHAANITSIGP